MDRTEQKAGIEVLSTSRQSGDAEAPDALGVPELGGDQDVPDATPAAGEISKADRIRIEDAATRYLLEETAGSADDWSTF